MNYRRLRWVECSLFGRCPLTPGLTFDPAAQVRPFTLGQLKELLNRTGTVVEEGFWIDKIKSHCYVTVSIST